MHISGFAFNSKEKNLPYEYRNRYHELIREEMDKLIVVDSTRTSFGCKEYEGTISQGGESLSELDIALILDRGTLAFGGDCFKISGNRFKCTILTD